MTEAHADIRLYLVVHETIRRILSRFVTATERCDPATLAPAIRSRWEVCVRGLHNHHEHEDAGFFPAIAAACADEAPLIARLEAEHAELVPKIDAADEAVRAFEANADAEHQRAAHDAIKEVRDLLFPHLDVEDAELLPAAAAKVPSDDWERLGDEALRAVPKRDLPIIAAAMDDVVRSLPEAERPPPPPLPLRVLVPLLWRRKYAKFIEPLEG